MPCCPPHNKSPPPCVRLGLGLQCTPHLSHVAVNMAESLLSPPQRQSASKRGALPMCTHRHASPGVRRRAATCAHNGTSPAHASHVRVSPLHLCTSARLHKQQPCTHASSTRASNQVKYSQTQGLWHWFWKHRTASDPVRRKACGFGAGSIVQRLIGMLCALMRMTSLSLISSHLVSARSVLSCGGELCR